MLIFSFIGFGICFVIHLATFLQTNLLIGNLIVVLLHVGAIICMCIMVFSVLSSSDLRYYKLNWSHSWNELFGLLPLWGQASILIFGLYAMINFYLVIGNIQPGSLDVLDGQYILRQDGQVVQELTANEYHLQQTYRARVASGHWMIFYLMPALFFWNKLKRKSLRQRKR